jgi:putative membrane protein
VKRAFIFTFAGYGIALLSEYSSIHNGFPYGHYFYIEQTRGKELWVMGVPFMDSLSYVFLTYASYSMAIIILSPLLSVGKTIYPLETKKIRNAFFTRILGSIYFVYLDIIIDPVALRGEKWFLGQIYGYPGEGVYFGVPISNFIGWFIVGFLLMTVLQAIDRFLYTKNIKDTFGVKYPWRYVIGPILYGSILVFNVIMTFIIHEYTLGWTGIFIIFLPSMLFFILVKVKLSSTAPQRAVLDHIRDFPQASPFISTEKQFDKIQ